MIQISDEITFSLPLKDSDSHATVDCLFTALDHAKAYHDHEETDNYVQMFSELEQRLREQADGQL